jgi:hypothetical protein
MRLNVHVLVVGVVLIVVVVVGVGYYGNLRRDDAASSLSSEAWLQNSSVSRFVDDGDVESVELGDERIVDYLDGCNLKKRKYIRNVQTSEVVATSIEELGKISARYVDFANNGLERFPIEKVDQNIVRQLVLTGNKISDADLAWIKNDLKGVRVFGYPQNSDLVKFGN